MPKYIDGIFNYCDAWCERCPFTSRCRNFKLGQAIERRKRRADTENAAFWDAMDKACGSALAQLTRTADSPGVADGPEGDVDEAERADRAAFGREMGERDKAIRAHPLAHLAERYLWDSHRWLERRRGRVPDAIADAYEIIAWYHMFISVKFSRALNGLMDQEEDDYEELLDDDGIPFPKDSDGSAKIAIIAIERSFAAWSLVRERVDPEKKDASKFMAMLLQMRTLADRTFPDARTFHRPGFDDVGSRD